MQDKRKIWVVIPLFNHSLKLSSLVDEILKTCPNILVIDDGSADADISGLLAGKKVELVSHGKNLGKGQAIRTAADTLTLKGAEYMVTIDADGQHYAEDISRFLDVLAAGADSIIIGTRNFNSPKIPLSSRIGRKISNFLIGMETGKWLSDTQSGFRAYPISLFKRIKCGSSGFQFETEIIVRGLWAGFDVSQLDISVYYPERKERISHFKFFKDNLRILLLHLFLVKEKLCSTKDK